MKDLTFSELLRRNRELGEALTGEPFSIAVLSNVVVAPLKEVLEFTLRSRGLNATVTIGNYDNIVQDALGVLDARAIIVFWELFNVIEGGQYKINLMGDAELKALESQVRDEIDLFLTNTRNASLVLFNTFSTLLFNYLNLEPDNFDLVADRLNEYLLQQDRSGLKVVNLDRAIAGTSVHASVDWRYFYSSRSPYTVRFYRHYAEYVGPLLMAAQGKAKKALIFDCDNTLWRGIVGEDGPDELQMSQDAYPGSVFREVQSIALQLARNGAILGLCSKNNPGDVDQVLRDHPDMFLKDTDFAAKKVSWDDKVSSMKSLAADLNIGMDSLVFIDDSSFEIGYVQANLPEITALKVPDALHQYPSMLRQAATLFQGLSHTAEDRRRTEMYREQTQREEHKMRFGDLNEYLKSLELRLTIHVDDSAFCARMAQMTQKTNQFNLTTRRYTDEDIRRFISDDGHSVIAFAAADKFGDYGLTGLAIIKLGSGGVAEMDTMLMSCRVIGRNLEHAFFDFIIDFLRKRGMAVLNASYIPSEKNVQVATLYDSFGLTLVRESGDAKHYRLKLLDFPGLDTGYIEVIYGGQG